MEFLISFLIFFFILQIVLWILFYLTISRYTAQNFNNSVRSVSVIICAKNAEKSLKRCLQSVLNQEYEDFEVLVANDFSTDDTENIIKCFMHSDERLRGFQPKYNSVGKKIALEEAVGMAKNNWILMTDADCVVSSSKWIKKMMATGTEDKDLILGYSPHFRQDGLLNNLIRYETFYIALQYLTAALCGYAYMGVGRNLAFRKSVFLKKRPFFNSHNMPYGDDDYIVSTLANSKNVAVCLDEDALTFSSPPNTIQAYFNQKRRHIRPSFHYKLYHKILLSLVAASHIGFYVLSFVLLFTKMWMIVLVFYLIRLFLTKLISLQLLSILHDEKVSCNISLIDPLLALSYFVHVLFLPIKKKNW